jgi:predicted nucleic acid-binding protein
LRSIWSRIPGRPFSVSQKPSSLLYRHSTLRRKLPHLVKNASAITCVKSVVADSGFLIGLFDETDPLHLRCRNFLKNYRGRVLTTEAVITEALALLAIEQQWRCLEWLGNATQAGLMVVDRAPLDFRTVEKLARKYADQPMDFADASVVLLATRSGISDILTADHRDFAVYRIGNHARFIDVLANEI